MIPTTPPATMHPAPRRLARHLIASLVAGAVALTGLTPGPARADDELARALIGIAAFAIIAKAIDDANDRRRTRAARPTPPPAWSDRTLPRRCLRDGRLAGRPVLYFAKRCLRREGVAGRLPQACRVRVMDHGRRVTGYRARCMLRSGYRLAERPRGGPRYR